MNMHIEKEWLWRWGRALGQVPFTLGEGCQCPPPPPPARKGGHLALDAYPYDPYAAAAARARARAAGGGRCRCRTVEAVLPSRPWEAYSLGIVLLFVPATFMVLLFGDFEKEKLGSARAFTDTDKVVSQVDVILVMVSGNVAVLQALLSRRHVHLFLEQVTMVDRLLRARPPCVQLSLLLWLSAVVSLSVLDVAYVYLSAGVVNALSHVPNHANYLLIYTVESLFAEDTHSIFSRFRTLNARLESACLAAASRYPLELRPVLTPVSVSDAPWKTPARSLLRVPRSDKSSRRGRARTLSESDATTLDGGGGGGGGAELGGVLIPVHHLEDAYDLLYSSARNVTRRYGPVLLIDILNLLLHFVTTAYFFFTVLVSDTQQQQQQRRSRISRDVYAVLQGLWLLCHLSRLWRLVQPCSRVKKEANKTGALVGTFLNTLHPSCDHRRQLEMFAMQLMHQRVTFSPCGLFELDLSLVVSLLGAVTTYLVVLLQIKVPLEKDGRSTSNRTPSSV